MELAAELGEAVDVPLDVVLVVLHRDRPLFLVAGGHEDAAVDHPGERCVEELRDRLQEVPVVFERLLAVGHAALGPQVDRVGRNAGVVDGALASLRQHGPQLAEVVVGVLRQDLREGGESGGHRQGVAVERPLHRNALGHGVHDPRFTAERPDGRTASDGLGERRQMGPDPEPLSGAAIGNRAAALDLVEDQHDPMCVTEVSEGLEVSGLGDDDADVHHHRLQDQRGDLAPVLPEEFLHRVRIVERDDDRVVPHGTGHALRRRLRRVGRARCVGRLAPHVEPHVEDV